MASMRRNRGQALVEVALVLPVLGLGVAVAVLLMVYAHNVICLQIMAAKAARRMTVETPHLAPVILSHPLWGRTVFPIQKAIPEPLEPWRPFRGLPVAPTVATAGQLMSVQINCRLLPGLGFSRDVASVMQSAAAETLIEPPRPAED
jgi:hypothetical protein